MIQRDFLIATCAITTWSKKKKNRWYILHTVFKKCMPCVYTCNDCLNYLNAPICCSCFCNEQLNKNVKCGKEYFTVNVSNIVLVIFKSFITFCWEKKRILKKI